MWQDVGLATVTQNIIRRFDGWHQTNIQRRQLITYS